jgi:hypothetical protein
MSDVVVLSITILVNLRHIHSEVHIHGGMGTVWGWTDIGGMIDALDKATFPKESMTWAGPIM